MGLASTLCLDPWQHSLHLLHILFSFVLDTWQVDLDHFFSLSTTCHHTPLGRSATQFKTIGYRRTRLIVQWTTTCPSSGRELRRSIDTIVATRFPQPSSSPPQTWTQSLKLGQADGKRFLFHPADSATLAHPCPLPVIQPTKIDCRLSRAISKWKFLYLLFLWKTKLNNSYKIYPFFRISTWRKLWYHTSHNIILNRIISEEESFNVERRSVLEANWSNKSYVTFNYHSRKEKSIDA